MDNFGYNPSRKNILSFKRSINVKIKALLSIVVIFFLIASSIFVILGETNGVILKNKSFSVSSMATPQTSALTFLNLSSGFQAQSENIPNQWIAQTVAGDGGFMTVGGNGFSFYKNNNLYTNQSFYMNGYIRSASYGNGQFILTGSNFDPSGGAILFSYNPQNNSLINITPHLYNALGNGLGVGSSDSLIGSAFYNNSFYVIGYYNSSGIDKVLFFSYNPSTQVFKNLSAGFNLGNNAVNFQFMNILTTNSGIVFYTDSMDRTTPLLAIYNSSWANLTSKISSSFISQFNYNSSDSNSFMYFTNNTLFLAGEYNSNPSVASIYLSTTTSQTKYFSLSNISNVGLTSISGNGNNLFISGYQQYNGDYKLPILIQFSNLNNFSSNISYLTGYIPSWFGGISSVSVLNSSIFITGGNQFARINAGILDVQNSQPVFPVVFTESGLPSGTSWSIALNGYITSSSTSTVIFNVSNGTYSYTIGSVSGYTVAPSSGNVTVNGQTFNQAITFTPVKVVSKYTVTFTESGLPSGTSWSVTFNGSTLSSTTNTISFTAANGTYSYNVNMANEYQAKPDSGMVIVSGANLYVSLTFSKLTASSVNAKFFASKFPVGSYFNYVQYFNQSTSVLFKGNNTTTTISTSSTMYLNYTIKDINDYVINISYSQVMVSSNGKSTSLSYLLTPTADIYSWAGYTAFSNQTTAALLFINTSDPASSYLPNSVNHSVSNSTISLSGNSYGTFLILDQLQGVHDGGNYTIKYDLNYAQSNGLALQGNMDLHFMYNSIAVRTVSNATNIIRLSSTNVASLVPSGAGYLKGTISPGNAVAMVDGNAIYVSGGNFSVLLSPGTYYISFTANGYNSTVKEINIQSGKTVVVNVVLSPLSNAVTLSGYVSPYTNYTSVVINGIITYVNSTGYYEQTVLPGTYTISVDENGYYPYSENVTISSSKTVNFVLTKEPAQTSSKQTGNVTASGYNVTITNLVSGNGNISLTFNSSTNGTLVVQIPFKDMGNATISEILNSTVYINGTVYRNYTVTISSNYTIILKVYSLKSGDPILFWKYSPFAKTPSAVSPPSGQIANAELYGILGIVVIASIIIATSGLTIRKRNKNKDKNRKE
ncbi:MAG: hypothetical protein ACYDAO_07225 [Thermoplasmataceae archaeon]